MSTPTKPKTREKDTQRLIIDWLAANRIWHMRLNTGAMKGSHKGKNWFVRFGVPGMADIIAVKPHLAQAFPPMASSMCMEMKPIIVTVPAAGTPYPIPVYWIEVKASKGVQSEDQKRFQAEVEAAGMTYVLAKGLEDVVKAIG